MRGKMKLRHKVSCLLDNPVQPQVLRNDFGHALMDVLVPLTGNVIRKNNTLDCMAAETRKHQIIHVEISIDRFDGISRYLIIPKLQPS